ncbi:putative amidohydrolase YtcJ [Geosmithia morbida]|uniref:Amidohydrolase YtcJ n=1 Tax=Geosmithia morbida TaxID=1094350 RepID=A0A9P5D764_9HYPO|nr:putative amidohydrolase YtcJ [Geosmithia morbida]KAF4126301.1 putative amidohydrolase YtcJ [Geosmithia morbida]
MLILSTAVVLVAAATLRFQQQQQQQQQQQPLSSSPATTYCYRSIRTHDQDRPTARCFSVANGFFVKVRDEIATEVDVDAEMLDPGHVIPGLWDGHGHLLQYGEFLHSVDLFGSQSLDDVRSRVRAYVDSHPGAGTKEQWLRGVGWDQTAFGRMPSANDISRDPQLKNIYMMLDRIDVHCAWVSQPVLDLLTPSDLPDSVPGGEIVRDPGMGVFCDNAMDIVTRLWPAPSDDVKASQVRSAMAELNSVGVVGMHDAGATPSTLRLYRRLSASSSAWTVRLYGMLECDRRNTFCPDDAPRGGGDAMFLPVRSVKLFADGALGSWGSAMIDPYSDHSWTSGSLLVNASALTGVTRSWAAEGYQVSIHAIGDLANRYAIDAIEAALLDLCGGDRSRLAGCQAAEHRFRIEHAQIIHPDDQARLLGLGIVPSIQPTHATSDARYAEARLGRDRLSSSAYRMRSLLPARPVLGSDFPVEPPNPFQGIYAAVTRRSPRAGPAGPGDGKSGFLTDEALSLDDALWGFTRGPAYGAFLEDKAGVIRPGAYADWVVLDEPLDEGTDIESLPSLRVRETWVGGRRVYSRHDGA